MSLHLLRKVALGRHESEPSAWMAMTGTAGVGEGCNKPFWLRQDAIDYVRRHGGYVEPLFVLRVSAPSLPDTSCKSEGE
jgi:hypothetical protein